MNPDTGQLAKIEAAAEITHTALEKAADTIAKFKTELEAKDAGFTEALTQEEFEKLVPMSRDKRLAYINLKGSIKAKNAAKSRAKKKIARASRKLNRTKKK